MCNLFKFGPRAIHVAHFDPLPYGTVDLYCTHTRRRNVKICKLTSKFLRSANLNLNQQTVLCPMPFGEALCLWSGKIFPDGKQDLKIRMIRVYLYRFWDPVCDQEISSLRLFIGHVTGTSICCRCWWVAAGFCLQYYTYITREKCPGYTCTIPTVINLHSEGSFGTMYYTVQYVGKDSRSNKTRPVQPMKRSCSNRRRSDDKPGSQNRNVLAGRLKHLQNSAWLLCRCPQLSNFCCTKRKLQSIMQTNHPSLTSPPKLNKLEHSIFTHWQHQTALHTVCISFQCLRLLSFGIPNASDDVNYHPHPAESKSLRSR